MLERLEVFNFKSYKGHHIIGPFKDFSCCIGPNGAGKSNLMDAISFVLGVRSAQLRSSQLKDLVYRAGIRDGEGQGDREGDKDRQEPMEPAARKAWVIAVYVDKKGKEWNYQRTITVTGASEYKINGKVVKLDYYNQTLEEHNILVKAKNFLVFQGDVEAVASQSPKDLTRLIEQISGSLELREDYEAARVAQDKATEISTHNFNKRRGINMEIKQFKEQKNEAERFAALRKEKDEAIVHHLLWKLYHIQDHLSTAAETIEEKNDLLGELREEQVKYEEALKIARKHMASAQKAVSKQEKEVKSREKSLEERRPNLLTIETKIAHADKKVKRAQEVTTEVERGKKEKDGVLKSLHDELKRVEKASKKQKDEQRRKSQGQGLTLNEDDLKEYNDLKGDSNKKASKERQDLEALDRELRTRRTELTSIKDKLEQATYDYNKLRDEELSLNEKKGKMDQQSKSSKHELALSRKKLSDVQAERTRINQQTTELNEKLAECYNKLQQAGADKKETEREARLKQILQDLQRVFPNGSVKGRIVDLCKPTIRKYDTAVSIVLGRNIDSVVVDSQKTAIDCMDYMRQQRAGVATFIPLDSITSKPINDRFRNYARGARLAIDVIEYSPEIERAMIFACGNALVCDNMDIARHVAFDREQEVKAVTLDGSMIHKSGLMTGGQDSRGAGRKWDEQEVTTLKKQEEHFKAQLMDLQKHKSRHTSDESMTNEITRLETDLTTLKDDLSITANRLNDTREKLAHFKQQIEDYTAKAGKISTKIDKDTERVDKLRFTIATAEDAVFSDYCKRIGVSDIRKYENQQLKEAQAEAEARMLLDTQMHRLRNMQAFESEQMTSITERLETLSKTVISETAKLVELEAQKVSVQNELADSLKGIEDLKEALGELQVELETRQTELDKVKMSASRSDRHFDRATKDINVLNDSIEKLVSERFGIYRRCKLEEINLPLKQGSLNNVPAEEVDDMDMNVDGNGEEEMPHADKIRDYGVEADFDNLEEDEQENSTPEMERKLLDVVTAFQADIDKMSPNMKAIERLDEVQAKLAATSNDFEQARNEAKGAKERFTEIKNQRCNIFNAAYNHISERIDDVYKDLTKGKTAPMGGVAYLSVEDTDEPYLHGVKYHAMPPMKRFRDMDQLSGGEKTMAALALLFAIHSFQPSPFFVLDEVDAALDNTNVGRIAEYVRSRASPDFQFVVISLKNSFWERARGLVGIWRDVEVGSSKVLTLDLEKYVEA